jgi:hypothetical protein
MTCAYLSQLTVPLKNADRAILLAFTACQTPSFPGWSQTSWILLIPGAIIFHVYISLQAKPWFIRKACQFADQSHFQ